MAQGTRVPDCPASGAASAYVRRYALNRLISPELLGRLLLRSYKKGECIIRSGEEVRNLFFFVEGSAKEYRQMENGASRLVAICHPLEILGDVELFAYQHYILTVEAMENSACLILPRAAIIERADNNGRLLVDLCGRLGRKLGDYNVASAVNLSYPVENRLASYLAACPDFKPEVNQTELAELLGASYRQLSRAIQHLKKDGILIRGRGCLRVADPGRLRALAGDLYLPLS